jgi:hypothetical protein
MSESGYVWPKPRRITVYIFDAQLNILKKIARESGLRLRHVMFQAFQSYIGAHSQEKENSDNAKRR